MSTGERLGVDGGEELGRASIDSVRRRASIDSVRRQSADGCDRRAGKSVRDSVHGGSFGNADCNAGSVVGSVVWDSHDLWGYKGVHENRMSNDGASWATIYSDQEESLIWVYDKYKGSVNKGSLLEYRERIKSYESNE